jgi:hypothetical protein
MIEETLETLEIPDELQQQICFKRISAIIAGGVLPGIMLEHALRCSAESRELGYDGWFYLGPAEWESATGLSFADQRAALNKLTHLSRRLVEVQPMGEPILPFWRVKEEMVAKAINLAVKKAAKRMAAADLSDAD